MYAEVEFPTECGLFVKTPDGVAPVSNRRPAFIIESFCFLAAAEQQRERKLALIAALRLEDEIDQIQFLVKAPRPEVCAVDEFFSYPDLHGIRL